jgi:hypothetical protein
MLSGIIKYQTKFFSCHWGPGDQIFRLLTYTYGINISCSMSCSYDVLLGFVVFEIFFKFVVLYVDLLDLLNIRIHGMHLPVIGITMCV